MNFPVCKHRKPKSATATGLQWLAAEPYRVFFLSGVMWSVAGALLWPLFHGGWLGFYPGVMHARLMIEGFGGAFVVGFLGTAGPRMASAPKLTRMELLWLIGVHEAGAVCHLRMQHGWGDLLFALLLGSLAVALGIRVARFGKELPPPQMLLALTGLVCGMTGAVMLGVPELAATPERYRLAGLLLYQGMLLPPTLGIGSFLFPRILGGSFGEAGTGDETRRRGCLGWGGGLGGGGGGGGGGAAVLLVGSFWLEAYGQAMAGTLLRLGVAGGYLVAEVRWRRMPGDPERGTLAKGLVWALGMGSVGLVLAAVFPVQRVSVEHLLYAGGFGLLILVVGSRVLFGHSGELEGFGRRSWVARAVIFLAVLTGLTRATTGFLPQLTVTHHVYAAMSWATVGLLWLTWHWRRFGKVEC